MLPLLTLLSCLTSPKDYKDLRELALDHDQDGYVSADYPEEGGDDCDDERPETYPGALERCDGLDNDCDGTIDEGVTELAGLYHDRDRDGYGGDPLTECPLPEPEDRSEVPGDCDDNNGAINPLATDVVEDDGRDQNCDGVDGKDGDGDGFASVETGGTDCNDANVTAFPGADEVCFDLTDNDCDGWIDEGDDNPCIEEGMLIITEFQPSSNLPPPTGEWIEVMNLSSEFLYMDSLQISILNGLSITPRVVVDGPLTIAPGQFVVLCYSTTAVQLCNFEYGDGMTYESDDTSIPNLSAIKGSITINVVVGGVNTLTDSVSYDFATSWPKAPDGEPGYSAELAFIAGRPSSERTPDVWCRNTTDIYYTVTEDGVDYSDYGTPGAPNTCTKE